MDQRKVARNALIVCLGPAGLLLLPFFLLMDSCSCVKSDPPVAAADFAWNTEVKKVEEVTPTPAKPETDYERAYREANTLDKPMFVLVGAKWCKPCNEMQSTTIPELQKSGDFNNVSYVHVDYDENPQFASQLMQNGDIPQCVIYKKRFGKFLTRRMFGFRTAQEVRSFINQN
jgi:thiol-disulfide isomerase/thioredoxin